ncbi:MAG: cyclic nucleotide-binding domain-containing protein [Spirochaetales bacterium]|nr:cyclic nucleotide-binding domain-containing protein [Spirochaetales bacterium]
MNKMLELLREIYFFQNLDDSTMEKIAKVCRRMTVADKEIIFREGDEANDFYLVLSGSVEVWKDYGSAEPDMLALHKNGHLFGEMAIVDELPRSATVLSCGKTELLSISRSDFFEIVQEDASIALSLMRSVSSMVRNSNESFVEGLREKNRNLEKANQELKEAQAELLRAERLSALGKFSSLILHDIRNPLSVIRGYAEMITLNQAKEDKLKKYANRIVSETDRINRLANELLDYSRGEIRLNIAIVNLRDLVKKLIEDIQERFASHAIKIASKVDFAGPVLFDHERIFRALCNLADNARKAMQDGGIFSIYIHSDENSFFIEVSDTGIGMSKDVLEHIFEPFCSFSKSGGTGLGTCIVKSVVEAHNGSLTVTSEEGKGTLFVMKFPIMS